MSSKSRLHRGRNRTSLNIMANTKDETQLSSMQMAVAQEYGMELFNRARNKLNKALGNAVAPQRLAAEDLLGHGLGWGFDLGQRMVLIKYLKSKPGESVDAYHKRWDMYSGGISTLVGGLGWVGAIFTNNSAPIDFGVMIGRQAASTAMFFGLNRLISSKLGIPG